MPPFDFVGNVTPDMVRARIDCPGATLAHPLGLETHLREHGIPGTPRPDNRPAPVSDERVDGVRPKPGLAGQ